MMARLGIVKPTTASKSNAVSRERELNRAAVRREAGFLTFRGVGWMGLGLFVPISRRAVLSFAGMVCLAVLALSPRPCQAGCGDYVVMRGSPVRVHEMFALDSPIKTARGERSLPATTKLPCNSPACRGEVPQPFSPPVVPTVSPAEKPLALFAAAVALEGGTLAAGWLLEDEHSRAGFHLLPNRPPIL